MRSAAQRPAAAVARRLGIAASLLAAATLASPAIAVAQAAAALDCGIEAGPERAVAAVIDGGTVRLDDGKEVRLAGILAPSARDAGAEAGSWPPEIEARAAVASLTMGRNVALGFGARREDRWGRVLAHLFVAHEGAQVWVQGRLVEIGHARVGPAPDDHACAARLIEGEREARAAGRGLWASAAYQVRPADRPSELAFYRGTFQLVRGVVERSSGTRSLVVLDLASSEGAGLGQPPPETAGEPARRGQRGTLRVVWRRALDTGLSSARGLAGSTVLVRGWVDVRAGPEIELVAKGQIEIEARAATTGRRGRQE